MKTFLKFLCNTILVIAILCTLAIVIYNLIIIARIMFFGMTVGSSNYPDSIWFTRQTLYGISGIKKFYFVWRSAVLLIELPIVVVCIIYQVIYFKIIRKKLKSK